MIVEKSTEWLILISVVVVVAVAYVLAWRAKQVAIRRIASVVVAAICTVSRRRITYCSNGEAVLPDDVAVVPVTLFDSTRRIGNETALERA
jgi:hypothetical protein